MRLDAATVLLQWAAGGMLFVWVTTRHRKLSLGYGWLMRGTYLVFLVGALVIARRYEPQTARDLVVLAMTLITFGGLVTSIVRRKAGVSNETGEAEFDPNWDLLAALVGLAGLLITDVGGDAGFFLAAPRLVFGALFLGAVTDAMLLGHWYLVQPGLPRASLLELVKWVGITWPFEVAMLLVPTGMISALNGDIDDGYGGILGWFWIASALTTIGLVFVTRAALKERYYSAVMAATGLLYLAILTGFGTDLVARAVLSS